MSSPYGNRLSPNMYWPAPERDTDTTPADNIQRDSLYAYLSSPASGHVYTPETLALIRQAEADIAAEQGDPQWAGPSLPHPDEATSEAEADELRQDWDDWQHGIEPNQEAQL